MQDIHVPYSDGPLTITEWNYEPPRIHEFTVQDGTVIVGNDDDANVILDTVEGSSAIEETPLESEM